MDKHKRRRRLILFASALVVVAVALGVWWETRPKEAPRDHLTLYGSTDIREVQLAFRVSDRITSVLVDEGDRVVAGQTLARLDTAVLRAELDESRGVADAAAQTLLRLKNGSRPEDIQRGRAALKEARALAADAQRKFAEVLEAAQDDAASQREFEAAQAARDAAQARVQALEAELALLIAGPRVEDIAQAKAELAAAQARLALREQRLADAELIAPVAGVIRARLREPGDMVGPDAPVLLIAQTDPVWVRVYIDEPDVGRVRLGMPAQITIDSHPGETFEGWLGSISPTAEFTPKPVATERLRTSLVYQARVFVRDPGEVFKLGMPATVVLSPADQDGNGDADRRDAGP